MLSYCNKATKSQGFTLLEVLLTVSMIGIISAFSAPVLTRLLTSSDLDTATTAVVRSTRRAQQLSRASSGDNTWGIRVGSGFVSVFMGTSYAARTDEEVTYFSTAISTGGITEIVYDKTLGLPDTTGNITLTNDNITRTVTVNAKGMVQY